MNILRQGFTILLLAILLPGCSKQVATHEDATASLRAPAATERMVASSWKEAAESNEVDDNWLQTFNDPKLPALVEEALHHNQGLKITKARVEEAEAMAVQAGAALKPTVGLSGGYSDRNSGNFGEIYGGSLKVSWEADVWGRIRSAAAGAEESAAATRSDFLFARQSIAASTSGAWFLAVGSTILAREADEIVDLLNQTVKIAEVRKKVGQATAREVHLAKADRASAQEAARAALAAQEDSKRSLEMLLGRYPGAEIDTAEQLDAVPPPVAAGIPSNLLERRPDLIAAEQQVAAAFYKQKEAELLHLPRFSFSIGLGLNSLTDAISRLGAGLFAPLYTGGAIEAEVAKATAVQKQAIAAYAQKALEAFKEVETALAAEEHLLQREEYISEVAAENRQAYELTRKQYEIGKIDMLDVLTVQNKWIQARIEQTNIHVQRLLNRIKLHLALGGSFESQPATTQ